MTAPYDKVVDIDRLALFLDKCDSRYAPVGGGGGGNVYYGTTSSGGYSYLKEVVVDDDGFSLQPGVVLCVAFESASITGQVSSVSVNGGPAINVKRNGMDVGGITNYMFSNTGLFLVLVYDGQVWNALPPGGDFLGVYDVGTAASTVAKMVNSAVPYIADGCFAVLVWEYGNTANEPTFQFTSPGSSGTPLTDAAGVKITPASKVNPNPGDTTLVVFYGGKWRILSKTYENDSAITDIKTNGVSLTPDAGGAVDIPLPIKVSDLTNDGDGTTGSEFATKAYVDAQSGGSGGEVVIWDTDTHVTSSHVRVLLPQEAETDRYFVGIEGYVSFGSAWYKHRFTEVLDPWTDSGGGHVINVMAGFKSNGEPYTMQVPIQVSFISGPPYAPINDGATGTCGFSIAHLSDDEIVLPSGGTPPYAAEVHITRITRRTDVTT